MQNTLTAIIAAMDDEVKHVASHMTVDVRIQSGAMLIRKGSYNGAAIVLVRSGIGGAAMRRAAKEVFNTMKPDICLHVGYCGGCDPRLLAGDMVIGQFAVAEGDDVGSGKISFDEKLAERALDACKKAGLRSSSGGIVTVEKAVNLPHEKADVGTRHNSIVLDMETFDLAYEAGANCVPLVVARAVLDPMEAELPDLGNAIDEAGKIDKVALLEGLAAKPKNILSIPKISYFANQARESISKFIDAWLSETI